MAIAAKGTGYPWRLNDRGDLIVPSVQVFGYVDDEMRWDWPEGMGADQPFMEAVIKTFQLMKAKGKLPLVMLRHNGDGGLPAEVVGKIDNISYSEPFLNVDLRFTRADAKGMAARGELPNLSVEIKTEVAYLWGVSFILGDEGYFNEELADFELAEQEGIEDLRKLAAADKSVTIRLRDPGTFTLAQKSSDGKVKLEDLAGTEARADLDLLRDRVDALEEGRREAYRRIENIENWVRRLAVARDEDAMSDTSDQNKSTSAAGDDAAKLREQLEETQKQLEAERYKLRALEADREIDAAVARLRKGGCALTDDQIRESLTQLGTAEGRAEREKLMAKHGVNLPNDDLPPDPASAATAIDEQIDAEYARLALEAKTQNRELHVTREDVASALRAGV